MSTTTNPALNIQVSVEKSNSQNDKYSYPPKIIRLKKSNLTRSTFMTTYPSSGSFDCTYFGGSQQQQQSKTSKTFSLSKNTCVKVINQQPPIISTPSSPLSLQEAKVPCPFCRFWFQKVNLRSHLSVCYAKNRSEREGSSKNWSLCQICHKKVEFKSIKVHLRTCYKRNSRRIFCHNCGIYLNSAQLFPHLHLCHSEKWSGKTSSACAGFRSRFTCRYCGIAFPGSESFQKHILVCRKWWREINPSEAVWDFDSGLELNDVVFKDFEDEVCVESAITEEIIPMKKEELWEIDEKDPTLTNDLKKDDGESFSMESMIKVEIEEAGEDWTILDVKKELD